MNSLHQPARIPLAVLAGLLVSVTACSDTATAPDAQTSASDVLFAKGGNSGNGGSGKPSGGDDPSDFRSTEVVFSDRVDEMGDPIDLITSDGRGEYRDGDCGVWANIGNFEDARFDPDRNYKPGKHGRSCGAARAVVFNFGDDGSGNDDVRSAGTFFNIDSLDVMSVTETRITEAQFNICNTLRFEKVIATRVSEREWTVTTEGFVTTTVTQQDGVVVEVTEEASDEATCSNANNSDEADDTHHNMPFFLTITDITIPEDISG